MVYKQRASYCSLKNKIRAEEDGVKNFIVGIFILLIGFSAVGCGESKEKGPIAEYQEMLGDVLGGDHRLRKMSERTEVKSKASGSFFLLYGDYKSSTDSKMYVRFAWEMNDGTYAISSLPIEKIRIKIDEKATTPTIEFVWGLRCFLCVRKDIQSMMDNVVDYAIVTARDRDWPIQVDLPLNPVKTAAP